MSGRTTLTAVLGVLLVALAAPSAHAKAKTTTCDPVDPRACLLPWPNNHFTIPNIDTETRRQVRLPETTPRNADGKKIDPFPYTLSDGFSPGSPILTHVPGLDLRRTGAVPITDLRSYDNKQAPIVLIDALTRKRQLFWAELDSGAGKTGDRLLMIHPAKNLVEGRRYIVALRNLKDSRGRVIKARKHFALLRAGKLRTARYDKIFRALGRHGVARSSLYLAWDFTVASQRNISERLTSIRDTAFSGLGDSNLVNRRVKGNAPAFKLDSVQELAACGTDGCQAGENDQLLRRVSGTVTVPCFLDKPGCASGGRFRYRKREGRFGFLFVPLRTKGNSVALPFTCIVPRLALSRKLRPALYTHDLLGGPNEVLDPSVQALAQEQGFVLCSVRQTGFSDQDAGLFSAVLRNASSFPSFADRLQQGVLGTLLMGRLMINPKGLGSQRAFQFSSGTSFIDQGKLFLNSTGLGGNFGTVVTALAPDHDRAVLGSTGMRFSLMLDRSTKLAPYAAALSKAYPDRVTRQIVLAMIQGLWDRGEANGFAARVTGDPPPNTPIHDVLLQLSVGDHTIPPVSSEVLLRSAETTIRAPAFDSGRSLDKIPFFGLTPVGLLELESTATVWDGGPVRAGGALGTPPAPLTNTPPTAGKDPHGLAQATVAARRQIGEFLLPLGKLLQEACPARRACRADGYPY